MAKANPNITKELISDYAAGRLDAEDVRVIEAAMNQDKVIATAVAAAREINSRIRIWLATSKSGVSRLGETPPPVTR